MALKTLGQEAPTLNTNTDLYTVPSDHETVASTILVCNRSLNESGNFRVAIRPAGVALAVKHYIYYDVTVPPCDTFAATIGIGLAETDVVTVRADISEMSFTMTGDEVEVT